ncbi:MAG: response regulator [Chthoniobacteraceae bacterium]
MAQASQKITEFPDGGAAPDPIASFPAGFLTQDRDPTREIRNLIEELQATAREARRRQRQAEEEREQLRGEGLDLREQLDSDISHNPQMKALARERDMLLAQQSQYGPMIADLKQRLRSFENDTREAIMERDAAVREKKQAQRVLEDAEHKREEAFRQRDAAARQRDLSKEERDNALEKAEVAKKNFADAQKALAEARHELSSTKKKGDCELTAQIASLRQARDGMAVQIRELKQRIGELEDALAEAGYAREAAEKLACDSKAELAEIQSVLEAAATGDDAQKIEQLDAAMLELQSQLAAAEKRNRTLAENEAQLTAGMAAMRTEMEASPGSMGDTPVLLDEARASLVAAQKQIEAIIRDRDSIREQFSANAVALEEQMHEQAAEIARLQRAIGENAGKLSERDQMQVRYEQRRLDMIELNAQLENARRDIRNLSASLAEARLHAKLAGRPVSGAPSAAPEDHRAPSQEAAQGRAEIVAMRRCFQAFSRDQKQVGLLGELETLSRKIANQAVNDGHPILHRVCGAFASMLGDLLELPEQITATTLRTLNQTIEFIALLLSDPEIEGSIKLNEARVYVVDDDPNCCTMAVEALGLVGLKANHTLYSSAAVTELAANKYDLIILDVHLPDLSGFDLSAHIRNMAPHAETPIFFITGDTSLENRVKSSLRGGSEFIPKPFSVQELALKALKSVITGQLRMR